MSHARLSPSRWPLYVRCAGAVWAEAQYPEEDSPYAANGTRQHKVLEVCLIAGVWDANNVREVEIDGKIVPVTDEDQGLVNEVLYYLRRRVEELGPDAVIRPEMKVDPGRLMDRADVKGTCDVMITCGRHLDVWDAKFGRGYVAADTEQLVAYAGGALDTLVSHQFDTIRRGILQPRFQHPDDAVPGVRWVETSKTELLNELAECSYALSATDDPNAPRTPGDHCVSKFCKARDGCPARIGRLVEEVDPVFGEIIVSPPPEVPSAVDALKTYPLVELDTATLVALYNSSEKVLEFIKGVEREVQRRTEAGEETGYKFIDGYGNRAWKDDLTEAQWEKKLRNWGLKDADMYTMKRRSPAQIEKNAKIAGNKRREASLQELWTKPEAAPKFVPLDDPHPARVRIVSPPPVPEPPVAWIDTINCDEL